jgi:hypothetical protein
MSSFEYLLSFYHNKQRRFQPYVWLLFSFTQQWHDATPLVIYALLYTSPVNRISAFALSYTGDISLHTEINTLKRWINPCTGLDKPWGFQEVQAPRFHDSPYIKLVRFSALRIGHLYPREIFVILISVRCCVDPSVIARQEGYW